MDKLIFLIALAVAVPAAADTTTVSLAGLTTNQWSGENFVGIPTGNVTLDNTPFLIDTTGNGARYYLASGTNPVTLTIPVSIFGATTAFTLINTLWGASGTFQTVTFNATGGLSASFGLAGNIDVRDYFQNTFTNSINGTTTEQVFNVGPRRLDRQTFVLPTSFAGETLTSVVFTDTGAFGTSRLALTALTIDSASAAVPEPASWAMLIAGFGLVGATLRRRRAITAA